MQIWVDADACPKAIKEILYRAASRTRTLVTLVANRPLHTPRTPFVKAVRVAHGFDVADHEITKRVRPGDLVVTADIPLAADVLEQGGFALSPRGRRFTEENIQESLAVREIADQLRSAGVPTGGPPPLGKGDRQAFAGELDRLLAARRQG